MDVNLEGLAPQTGHLSIDIRLQADVNVSAFVARQKVTGFVADHISTNLHGGEPSLHVGARITWRVPVVLSLPPQGDLGDVGAIDVDVETGQLSVTPTLVEEIQRRAESLAAGSTHPTA